MSDLAGMLAKDKEASDAKSYLIGLERGRVWAEDHADYIERKEWSELDADQFDELVLPGNEEMHFRLLMDETSVEWSAYLRGWLHGVKESVGKC
ncbi:MAG: hypothetical protein V1827_05100 [Candidatus Micrarchaeota archaeon]